MSGNNTVAVRRPRSRAAGDLVPIRGAVAASSPAALKADLDRRFADGTLRSHGRSRPHPTMPGFVVVDVVLLEPRPVAARSRTRTILFLSIGAVLLASTVLLGYLAFMRTATILATEAKGLLGCMVIAAIVVAAIGGRRRGGGTGSACACNCVVIHICRR